MNKACCHIACKEFMDSISETGSYNLECHSCGKEHTVLKVMYAGDWLTGYNGKEFSYVVIDELATRKDLDEIVDPKLIPLDKVIEEFCKDEEFKQIYQQELTNWQEIFKETPKKSDNCLHNSCSKCHGTGIDKETKQSCVHGMSCPCDMCSFK